MIRFYQFGDNIVKINFLGIETLRRFEKDVFNK
jgi:hypothetical protein